VHRAQALPAVAPERDWAGNWRSFALYWGLPWAVMMVAGALDPLGRAIVWTAALLWMGGACLVNARRCSRTHCRFTGPFFILMAAVLVADASGVLRLGANGWAILGGFTLIGAIGIWWVTERLWGKFTS
jgi:hypothetical protein